MNIFLKKIGFFTLSYSIVICMIFCANMRYNAQIPCNIPKDKNILIMGHSHTECAINDTIVNRAINLSQSGRPLVTSCNWIKKIVQFSPHIDTVVLGVNSYLLTDQWIKTQNPNKHNNVSKSIFLYGDLNQLNYLFCNFIDSSDLLFYSFHLFNIKNILRREITLDGSYLFLYRDKLQQDIDLRKDEFPLKAEIDTTLYEYRTLLATKQMLDKKGVHLILIDTPKYNPRGEYMEQEKFHTLIKEYLPQFDYIDYVSFPLPKEGYGDITHLNHKGAKIFSEYLQENGFTTL